MEMGHGDINADQRANWTREYRIYIIVALLVSFIGITTTCLVPNIVDFILVKVTPADFPLLTAVDELIRRSPTLL